MGKALLVSAMLMVEASPGLSSPMYSPPNHASCPILYLGVEVGVPLFVVQSAQTHVSIVLTVLSTLTASAHHVLSSS